MPPAALVAGSNEGRRRTSVTSLCEDLDHAGGRLGTVQRRRGGALDDLDPLDVRGVDGIQGAGDVVTAPAGVSRGRHVLVERVAANTDAVDVDERLVAHGDRDVATQADLRSTARHARTLHHRHACDPGLQERIYVRQGFDHVGDFDPGDRVADLPTTGGACGARDDDLVEAQRLDPHGEVLRHGAAGGHVDLDILRTESETLDSERVTPDRDVQDDKATSRGRDGPEAGVDQIDLRGPDARTRSPLRYGPSNRSGLLGRAGLSHEGERHRDDYGCSS